MSTPALPIDLAKPGLREYIDLAERAGGMFIEFSEDAPGVVTKVRIATNRMSLDRKDIDELVDVLLGPVPAGETPMAAYWCLPHRTAYVGRSDASIFYRYVDDTDRYLYEVFIQPSPDEDSDSPPC